MSVQKVKTKSGEVKWLVRVRENGRGSKQVGRRFDRKADAESFLLERLTSLKENKSSSGLPALLDTTFAEEVQFWLDRKGPTFSPTHLVRVKVICRGLLKKYGSHRPDRFHPGLLTQIQTEELAAKLAPASVNRKIEVIKAILSFSTRCRRIPTNPTTGFQKLKVVREGIDFWEEAIAETFLLFADQKYPFGSAMRWVYVAYLMALNTAMRGGELWGLRASDLVQGGELLYVQRQFDRLTKVFRYTKGKRPRYVPCNDALLVELNALIASRKLSPNDTFFRRENGSPVCHEAFVNAFFQRDCKTAGVRRIRFHDLRHTATTLMIAKGLDLKTVQEICGHKSIATTMEYVHLLGDKVKEARMVFSILPRQPKQEETCAIVKIAAMAT